MKTTSTFVAALLAAACLAALPARADDLLDLQLGPPTPATDKPQPKDAAPKAEEKPQPKPAAKPDAPRAPEIISPDAAKTVDDQDLIRELTQPGSDKPDPQKVEERMKAM